MNTSELISVIANIALALSFLVGLIFGMAQVSAATRDRRERLTIEVLRNFQTREFAELSLFVISKEMPVNREEMDALPMNEQAMLFQLSQQMESLGILVAEKFINIDLVDITLGSFVVTAWEKYQPMFTYIRENQPDPFLGEYFQWLAEKMNERLQTHPREPFYKIHKPVLTGHSANRRFSWSYKRPHTAKPFL